MTACSFISYVLPCYTIFIIVFHNIAMCKYIYLAFWVYKGLVVFKLRRQDYLVGHQRAEGQQRRRMLVFTVLKHFILVVNGTVINI